MAESPTRAELAGEIRSWQEKTLPDDSTLTGVLREDLAQWLKDYIDVWLELNE